MISSQPIADLDGTPTMSFVSEWRQAGPLQGLPRWMIIVNADGSPTGAFMSLARKAFNLSPAIGITVRDAIVNFGIEDVTDGTPTDLMITAWNEWTS